MNFDRNYKTEVVCGNNLNNNVADALDYDNLILTLKGSGKDGLRRAIPFTEDYLSKHLLLLGGIGTGKTNTFNMLISQIKPKMTEDDVMIIFDTKGDFYNTFYQEGDVVISNDELSKEGEYWNIFREIEAGPRMMESITEISKRVFAEACEKTNQVFFPNAARGIFEAILWHFMHNDPRDRSNYWLMDYINTKTSTEIREMLYSYDEFRAMTSYISIDDSAQTQGVLSELQQVCREIFIGNFKDVGTLSIKNIVQEKNGKTVFIEYDLATGKALSPIYSLMFDIAIKTALGRKRSEGNVYLVTDEFRLLPNLEHIDDAVNFGRSLGLKFIMGIQNVEQVYEHYGQERARSILSGFQTVISFKLNDATSREYVQTVFGKNRKLESYRPTIATQGMQEEIRDGMVVEDWDIVNLKTGEAIVGLPEQEPFIYKFDLFKS